MFYRPLKVLMLSLVLCPLVALTAQKDLHAQSTTNDRYFSAMMSDRCMPNIGHADYQAAAGSSGIIKSAKDGFWDDGSTWIGGQAPDITKAAIINHHVVIRSQSAEAFDTVIYPSSGHLEFLSGENTKLRTGTLFTFPGSRLTIGTEASPINATKLAEIAFINRPIVSAADPAQYSHGFLAAGGKISIHGSIIQNSFLQLRKELKAGDTKVLLEKPPTNWAAGHITHNYGVVTVQADSNNSVIAWVLRKKDNCYVIPLQATE